MCLVHVFFVDIFRSVIEYVVFRSFKLRILNEMLTWAHFHFKIRIVNFVDDFVWFNNCYLDRKAMLGVFNADVKRKILETLDSKVYT